MSGNNHDTDTKYCNIRCKTANTPCKQCECSCGGRHHGTQSSIRQFGSVQIEEDAQHPRKDPRRELVTIADSDDYSIDDIDVESRISILFEYADSGWSLHRGLEVEAIRSSGIVVEKPDGFSTVAKPTQIPVRQFA